MTNFMKKKETIIEATVDKIVDGVEVWLVTWDARFGELSSNTKKVAKAFLNKNDAKQFINNLTAAQEILQYTEDIHIKLEKQI